MISGFEFVHGDRTFTCAAESLRPSSDDIWWWFRVSTETSQRYAPFRAAAGDTRDSVQARIVAYYETMMARRAEPAPSYWRRGAPKAQTQPQPQPTAATTE